MKADTRNFNHNYQYNNQSIIAIDKETPEVNFVIRNNYLHGLI